MDDKAQLEILLRASGFRIARQKKHEIWKRADGKIWVVPRTPSDRYAYKNALSHFRAFLAGRRFGVIHQAVPRIPPAPKAVSAPPIPSAKPPRRRRVTQTKPEAIQPPEPKLTCLNLTAEHVYRFGSLFQRTLQENFLRPRMDALIEDLVQSCDGQLSREEIEKLPELRSIRNLEMKLTSFTVKLFQSAMREIAANGKIGRFALQEKLKEKCKKLFPGEGRTMRGVRRWLVRTGFIAMNQYFRRCAMTDEGIPVLVPRGGGFVIQLVK